MVFITSRYLWIFIKFIKDQTLEFEKQSTELLTIEERIEQLDEDKVFLKEELEQTISELPDNYIHQKKSKRRIQSTNHTNQSRIIRIQNKTTRFRNRISINRC